MPLPGAGAVCVVVVRTAGVLVRDGVAAAAGGRSCRWRPGGRRRRLAETDEGPRGRGERSARAVRYAAFLRSSRGSSPDGRMSGRKRGRRSARVANHAPINPNSSGGSSAEGERAAVLA